MRAVEWSLDALSDLEDAIDYISQRSDASATVVAQRMLRTVDLLGEFPTGHQGRVIGTYEKLVQRTPYIVAYMISDRVVYIVRVIHGSRDWPEGEWPAE